MTLEKNTLGGAVETLPTHEQAVTRRWTKWRSTVGAAVVAVVLSACGGGGDDDSTQPPATNPDTPTQPVNPGTPTQPNTPPPHQNVTLDGFTFTPAGTLSTVTGELRVDAANIGFDPRIDLTKVSASQLADNYAIQCNYILGDKPYFSVTFTDPNNKPIMEGSQLCQVTGTGDVKSATEDTTNTQTGTAKVNIDTRKPRLLYNSLTWSGESSGGENLRDEFGVTDGTKTTITLSKTSYLSNHVKYDPATETLTWDSLASQNGVPTSMTFDVTDEGGNVSQGTVNLTSAPPVVTPPVVTPPSCPPGHILVGDVCF